MAETPSITSNPPVFLQPNQQAARTSSSTSSPQSGDQRGIAPNSSPPFPNLKGNQIAYARGVAGNVDPKVSAAGKEAFKNHGSGTKGVSDSKCFPVCKEAWQNLYQTDLTSYKQGDKSVMGKPLDTLLTLLPSKPAGTVLWCNTDNNNPNNQDSMNSECRNHWAMFDGKNIIDNWNHEWSISEFVKYYSVADTGKPRLLEEIIVPPGNSNNSDIG